MKNKLLLTLTFSFGLINAQNLTPKDLVGTWKTENTNQYEHWDQLDSNTFRGFSYEKTDNGIKVSEYLDIRKNGNKMTYTATVLDQNNGKPIIFVQKNNSKDELIFENLSHDFPKKIVYKRLNNNQLQVNLSDNAKKNYLYNIFREDSEPIISKNSPNPNYDKALAQKLKADEYGMKTYFFVLLKTGSNKTTDKKFISDTFKGHMTNIEALVKAKKLIVAGPYGKNTNDYRGLFILDNIASLQEAEQLLQTDPAIKNNLLQAEVTEWYGSAALPEYLPFSDKIWEKNH